MRVTIHQPEHAPWIGFFHKVDQADMLVLLDNVQFRKNYFGNRNQLLGPQGPFWVTVPVRRQGLETTYAEVEIADDPRWKKRYHKSVLFNYRNHPFFADVLPLVEEALEQPFERLAELNECLVRGMLGLFGIRVPIVRASQLAAGGRSTELLLAICREVKADAYLAGGLGKDYMDDGLLLARGIEVLHNRFEHPTYPQRGTARFVERLSALDLLMNCGPESLGIVRSTGTRAAPLTT